MFDYDKPCISGGFAHKGCAVTEWSMMLITERWYTCAEFQNVRFVSAQDALAAIDRRINR